MNTIDPPVEALAGKPTRKPRARKSPAYLKAVWKNPLEFSYERAPRPTGALCRTAKAARRVAADHALRVHGDPLAKTSVLVNTPTDRTLGYLDRLLILPHPWPPGYQAFQVAYHLSAGFCAEEDQATRFTWAAAFSAAVYAAELARAPRRRRMTCSVWGRGRRGRR